MDRKLYPEGDNSTCFRADWTALRKDLCYPKRRWNQALQNNVSDHAMLTGRTRSFVLKGMPPTVKFSWYSPLSRVNRSPETAIFITASLLTFITKLLSSSSTEIWKSKIANRIIQDKNNVVSAASTKGQTPLVKSSRHRKSPSLLVYVLGDIPPWYVNLYSRKQRGLDRMAKKAQLLKTATQKNEWINCMTFVGCSMQNVNTVTSY